MFSNVFLFCFLVCFVRCTLSFEIGKCEALYVFVITGLVQNSKLAGVDSMDWRPLERKKDCVSPFSVPLLELKVFS